MSNDLSLITITDHLANFDSMPAILVLGINDCTYLGIPSFLQSCTCISFSNSERPSFSCSKYFSMNLKVLLSDCSVWLSKAALQSPRPLSGGGVQFVGWCSPSGVALAVSVARRTLSNPAGTGKAWGPCTAASDTAALSVLRGSQTKSHRCVHIRNCCLCSH